MRRLTLFKMDIPYREPLRVTGLEFGVSHGTPTAAIVGSTRGDEVQQAFICANLVAGLKELEEGGALAEGSRILVIPCTNPLSLNVGSRFWPADGTDINRLFPGKADGETTELVAAGVFASLRGSAYGLQLCSFNQQGDFLPHVRVTRAGAVSEESLAIAGDFGLPCVVSRDPTPFDTGTLNYSWQSHGTNAFSLYSATTDRIDRTSAEQVIESVLRFLAARGILRTRVPRGSVSRQLDERELVDVRTMTGSGYLENNVVVGETVEKGQELGRVLDGLDAHVRERLVAPTSGRIFFCRTQALIQQRMVVYRIAPEA